MALSADMLNSEATLNVFIEIGSKDFIPGEEIRLVFRFANPDLDLRYIPPATTVAEFTFNKTDGSTFNKTAALTSDDRSIATLDLEEIETEDLSGGNIGFNLDVNGDGSKILKGIIKNGLRRVSSDC